MQMKSLRMILLGAGILALCGCTPQGGQQKDTAMDSVAVNQGNPVVENIMSRRSIRKYKPEAVEREKMQTIVECGINAPNGMNKQSWEVRVVDNPEFINGLTEIFKKENPKAGERPGFKNMFNDAPTVVFIANDPKYDLSRVDCGLLGENMMLSAWSMGIGSCCLGGPVRFMNSPAAAEYMKQLGFSEGYELLYAIAFGYPDETPAAKPRDTSKVKFVD
jgi:nitroreductase